MKKIHEKIYNLFPHIEDNFLTYPLLEEGNCTPFLNFWVSRKVKITNVWGYQIEPDESFDNTRVVVYQVYPSFDVLENGKVKYSKKDWSIEEMIDIIDSIVNQNKD